MEMKRIGRDADSQLIVAHMPLVGRIARQVYYRSNSHIEIEELEQHGMLALVEAARTYQDIGLGFTSYATMRIRGAMIDQLRRTARVSRATMNMQKRVRRAVAHLEQALARPPSILEIAGELQLSVAAVDAHRDAVQKSQTASIDEHYSDQDARFSDPVPNAECRLLEQSLFASLAAGFATLASREADVLRRYFVDGASLNEIGRKMDIGAARVCQIKKAACAKLRAYMVKQDVL